MPQVKIGNTVIPYELERRDNIERRYIRITPGQVLVTVPSNDSQRDIDGFLSRKERWLYNNTQRVNTLLAGGHSVHRFLSAIKIPYRGRRVKLVIARKTTPNVDVEYKNGFIVSLPDYVTDETQDDIIESALRFWMKQQIKRDIADISKRLSAKHGLKPKYVRVKEHKHMWGSCAKDGGINLNWQLIFAPKPVLEYAVLHEMCHLKERTHDKRFWAYLKSLMPDYEARKIWLDENENLMGYRRLKD